jgi:hypothetical protein
MWYLEALGSMETEHDNGEHVLYWKHRDLLWCLGSRVQKGKELNDFQRNLLDIEILSNLRFGSLETRDTSVIVRYSRK